ncbi:MAG: zinc-ribbon domain-containing protein [Chloroflexi bacterium]|nr:zinc-ribbon domain-containing protein [Chloroflexota bacterium]
MVFCNKCGQRNPDTAGFCSKCGARLGGAGPSGALPEESGTGLEPNIAGVLCYALGWLTGIVFLIIEKEDRFVRFHALQSIVVFGAITVIAIVLGAFSIIPIVGIAFRVMGWIWWAGAFGLWILLMLKAYWGEWFKVPKAGDIAERYL